MPIPKRVPAAVSLLILALASLAGPASAVPPATNLLLRVMTFNVRFDFPDDGANRWPNRVDLIAEAIHDSKASVVCLQEDKREQVDDLRKAMPGWEFVGRGRNANGSGEACSIGFQTATWRCAETGDFWLSDEPDKPGSNTWGTKYPHKVTWASLESVKDAKRRRVLFLSTHFDEIKGNDEVRARSASVIRNWISRNAGRANAVLCGDFNAGPDEGPHDVLTAAAGPGPRFSDAWEAAKPGDPMPGTVHDFTGHPNRRRIDWILFAGRVSAREARVERYSRDGRWPSDHFPVSVELAVAGDPADAKKDPVPVGSGGSGAGR